MSENVFSCVTFLLCSLALATGGRLSIHRGEFYFDSQHIFLSGANIPWTDFYLATDNWEDPGREDFTSEIKELYNASANSLRTWIHAQGEISPCFDEDGFVTGLDNNTGVFITHFMELLDIAQQHNILVFPSLWNASPSKESSLDELILNETKLQSYIDNALTPLVNAVKYHPALGGWDIVNEPEAMLIVNQQNNDSCYDTTGLDGTGAGSGSHKYTYEKLLKFINLQAAAIKAADPTALVTVGVWNPKSNIDIQGYFNHYKDECLLKAGGDPQGTLDFWQFHDYPWGGKFDNTSVFSNNAVDYFSDKPIVVGEFWEMVPGGMTDHEMFQYIYNNNYQGAWVMIHKVDPILDSAVKSIANLTSNGVIPIIIS